VRIRFRNNVIFGANDEAFSPWLNSNELYFDRPSKPRKNDIDYLTTLPNGLTRVNQIVIDPSFVLGENDTTNYMKFTGIKFFWKSDNIEEWKPFTRIRDTRKTPDEIQLINGEYIINNAFSDDPFTYTFDICSTYLGTDATNLIDDGSKNMSVYIQYRNSAISAYSDLLESNVILLEPPAQPVSVDLSFLRTETADFRNPKTECSIIIEEPNVMRTQPEYDDDLCFNAVQLQWKKDDEWYNFAKIKYVVNESPELIELDDGVHYHITPKSTSRKYVFDVSTAFLGNNFIPMNSGDTLEVQVRYQNSVLTEFSEYKNSNELLFEEPSDVLSIDVSFSKTLDISNTRYIISISKPLNMLKTDDSNNAKIRLSGIGLEWGISAEDMNWIPFNNIATREDISSNRMIDGVYLTNAAYTAIPQQFYFDTTETYLGNDVNALLVDQEKYIVVRTRFRNTTVPEFTEYLNSNDLLLNRPSDTRQFTSAFLKSTDITETVLNIQLPEYTVSGEELGNERIDLTGIRFEWRYDDTWVDFQKIKLISDISNEIPNNVKILSDGVLPIQYKNTILDVSYVFNITPEYLGEYILYDTSSIDIRVSYRNSTIGPELTEGYNTPIDTNLFFEVPSEPLSVELDFNSTIGGYNTPITLCQIKVKDPLNTLKTVNNPHVNLKDISFQWRLDENEWNDIIKINLGDISYDVPFVINRARDDEERTYTFEMNSTYMQNFVQPVDGSNLEVRTAYRNTILPDLFSDVTTSANLLFEKPSNTELNELFFNMTIDVSNTECYIQVEKPQYSHGNRSVLNYTGIEIKWGISGENLTWYDFENIAISRQQRVLIPTNQVIDSVYLINTSEPANVLYFETNQLYLGDNISELINDTRKELIVKVRFRNSAVPDWNEDLSSNMILFNKPSQIQRVDLNISGITDMYTTECKIQIHKPIEFIEDFDYGDANIQITRVKFEWKYNDEEWRDFTGIKRDTDIISLTDGIYNILPIKDTLEFEEYLFDICSNCLGANPFPLDTTENVTFYVRARYSNSVSTAFSDDSSANIVFGKTNTPTISEVQMITPKSIKVTIDELPLQDIINGFGGVVSTNEGIFIAMIDLRVSYQLDEDEPIEVNDEIIYNNGQNDILYNLPREISALNTYTLKFRLRAKNNLVDVWSDLDTNEVPESQTLVILEAENTNQLIETMSVDGASNLTVSWEHPSLRGVEKAIAGLPLIQKYVFNVGEITDTSVYDYDYETDIGNDALNSGTLDVFSVINGSTIDEVKFINAVINQNNPYVTKQTSISGKLPFKLEQLGNPAIQLSSNINTSGLNILTLSWSPSSETGFLVGELDGEDANIPVPVNISTYIVSVSSSDSSSPVYKLSNIPQPSFNESITAPNRGNARTTILETTSALTNAYNDILVYPETKYTVTLVAQNIYGSTSQMVTEEEITSVPPIPSGLSYIIALPTALITNIQTSIPKYTLSGFILNENPNTTTDFTTVHINRPATAVYTSPPITHVINKSKLNSWIDVDLENISNVKARRFEIINEADDSLIYALGTNTNLYDTEPAETQNYIISMTSKNREDIYSMQGRDPANRGYWWKEDISYSIDFSNNRLYGKPVKLKFQLKYNSSTSKEEYNDFDFGTVGEDVSAIILQDGANSNTFAYFDDLSLNAEFKDMVDISNITDVENKNAINGIPNIYPIGVVNQVVYETKYKLNHSLINYSKYFGMSGEIVNYELIKDGSVFYGSKLQSISWANKPTQMKREEREWELSGVEIEIPEINTNTTTGIQIRANYRNQLMTTYASHVLSRKFIYDKVSVERFRILRMPNNATSSDSSFSLPTGIGELIQVPTDFNPNDPLGSTQSTPFTDNVYNDFSQYNPKQLIFYNGSFRTYENMKSLIDVTNENVRREYGITGSFTEEYSYVMFKFIRNKSNSVSASANTPYKFVMSFNEETNITYNDLKDGDVKVYVLIKSNGNDTVYPSNTGDYSFTEDTITYRWVLYEPNTNFGSAAVADITTMSVSISEGLGSNNDTTDRFTNSNSGIGSFTNATTTYYSTSKRNLSGVFYASGNFNNDLSLSFYVAIGIKNTLNRYINNITSFDVIDTTNNIGRGSQ
jgi:hypothetical protein